MKALPRSHGPGCACAQPPSPQRQAAGGAMGGVWTGSHPRHSPAFSPPAHLFSPSPLQPRRPRCARRPHSTGQHQCGVTARAWGAQVGGAAVPQHGSLSPLRARSLSLLCLLGLVFGSPPWEASCPLAFPPRMATSSCGSAALTAPWGSSPQPARGPGPCVAGGHPTE